MKTLKLIISFILLISLFLGVVSCTPDEESKAESSADVSEDVSETVSADMSTDESEDVSMEESGDISENVSETVSEDVSTDESEEETNIKLRLQNEEIVTLDKYKDGKELCLVVLTKDNDVIKNDIVDKFNYTAKDIIDGNPSDEDYQKLVADVATLLPDYRQDMIDEFVTKYDLDTDDAFLEDKFIFRFDEEVTWAWSSDINEYYVYILVYLDELETDKIKKEYTIEFFDGISISTNTVGYSYTYRSFCLYYPCDLPE